MPQHSRALTRAARDRASSTGENYTAARAAVLAAQAGPARPTVTAILPAAVAAIPCGPWPYELVTSPGLTVPDELGVRALPDDASPAARARAEATWRPSHTGFPCRCSGQCQHGEPCEDGEPGEVCGGHVIHIDRYPSSPLAITVWEDIYSCDTCTGNDTAATVTLPDLPWGTIDPNPADGTITTPFPGVRHPADDPDFYDDDTEYADLDDDEDREYECGECGGLVNAAGYGCECK